MSKYMFSPSTNAFYPVALQSRYEEANMWPNDGVGCEEDVFSEFTGVPPEGKRRGSDKDGNPAWIDVPPLTKEQQIANAKSMQQYLIDQANDFMNSKQWLGKAAIGRLKDAELNQYNIWLDYLDALYAVDTSTAPEITWPEQPQ